MEDLILRSDVQQEFSAEPIQLEPFIHQVGGHSSILCLDERTVAKPLIKQELKFYESLPKSLKKFTPEYRGVVQVRFEESPDGYIQLAAYPQKPIPHSNNKKPKKNNRRIRLKSTGSIEIEIDELEKDNSHSASSPATNNSTRLRAHNPWALQCHQKQLSKLRRSNQQKENSQKFLLLENIAWRFEYPCVLDLKMGTRQYGDNATPDKIQSKSAKAANSTSVQLGVRICGMQVYQASTGKFMCQDKYYGQKLDVSGFKGGIIQFLHNGSRLRKDAMIPLIEKLEQLKSVLLTLDTHRFYTSSLLLTYEGLDPVDTGSHSHEGTPNSLNAESVDVRMIDFAHATHSGLDLGHCAKEHAGPDTGYIFGLSNLINVLQEIVHDNFV